MSNGLTIEPTTGQCPDCVRSQEVSKGSSHTCVNADCRLVAPSSAFRQLAPSNRGIQSAANRAWTLGGAVD